MGFRHWAWTPPVSRRSRQSATGPPGGYPDRTHTGKRRRADDTRSTTYTVNLLSLGARKGLVVVIIGIDPHMRTPTASALDPDTHRVLASVQFEASLAGYR